MFRSTPRTFALLLALAASLVFAAAAFAVHKIPPDMVLAVPEGAKSTQPPVKFSHMGHSNAKVDCVTCHHKWDGKSEVQGCSAAGCHDDFKAKRGEKSYYAAFHDRKADTSCLGCHQAKKSEGVKAPTGCKDCHVK